jgi:UDP-N-acetylglucosamine 2-epimerase (non-hydrolysing)
VIHGLNSLTLSPRLYLTDPIGYLEFLGLQKGAALVITDSGGIQEETTYLRIPCLTVRENTERPVTVELGSNVLVGRDAERLRAEAQRILSSPGPKGIVPELWDGKAGERLADVVARYPQN